MKKILVPTDFSSCANAASDFAIELAKKAEAELCFMHLQDTPSDWIGLSTEQEKQYPEILHAIGEAKAELNEWIKKANEKGVKAERSLVLTAERDTVFKSAEDHHYDLLVMGSHGERGLREKMMGSNAQYFLRHAKVPLLTVKYPVADPVKNIVFVSDFKDLCEDSFRALTDFAEVVDAHINLLFVSTPSGLQETEETARNMSLAMEYDKREGRCTKNVVSANSVVEGVEQFMEKTPTSLIAICTHGKTGFQQLFSPSIAEKVQRNSKLPVLSIRLV